MIEKKLIFAVLIFATLSHAADKSDSLFFVSSNRGLDYKIAGKKDAHRFGVELKENKQFHHTITAEDGVRLGCHGYELNGLKYATNYIADGKGYRLAPNSDLITVFAKGSSEPRVASFKESFTAEEIEKANIRYFFPEGCEAPMIFYDPNNPSRQFEERRKLFDTLVQKTQAEKLKSLSLSNKSSTASNDAAKGKNANNSSNSLNSQNNINNHNKGSNNGNINGSSNSSLTSSHLSGGNGNNDLSKHPHRGSDNLANSLQSSQHPGSGYDLSRPGGKSGANKNGVNGGSGDDCCSTGFQIILPHSSCSTKIAKIVIPIESEKLSGDAIIKELMEIAKESSPNMLQKLQKLAVKYEL